MKGLGTGIHAAPEPEGIQQALEQKSVPKLGKTKGLGTGTHVAPAAEGIQQACGQTVEKLLYFWDGFS